MSPAEPPSPPPEPAPSQSSPVETPAAEGSGARQPEGAGAKPSAPGPVDPPGIVTSILPQRLEDARRAGNPPASNDH